MRKDRNIIQLKLTGNIVKRDIEIAFYIPFNSLIQTYNSMDLMHHQRANYLLALQVKTVFQ